MSVVDLTSDSPGYFVSGMPAFPVMQQPDVDHMSHEQLEDLCEEIGDVNVGLKKSQIDKLPVITFQKSSDSKPSTGTDAQDDSENMCVICRDDFADGDVLIKLPCNHLFHKPCIAHWLEEKPRCPMCNAHVNV